MIQRDELFKMIDFLTSVSNVLFASQLNDALWKEIGTDFFNDVTTVWVCQLCQHDPIIQNVPKLQKNKKECKFSCNF